MPLPVVPLAVTAVLYGAANAKPRGRSAKGDTKKKRKRTRRGSMGSLGAVGRRRKRTREAVSDELPASARPAAPDTRVRVVRRQPVTDGSQRRQTFPYKEALQTWGDAPWKDRVKELSADKDERTPTEVAAIIAGDLWGDQKWPAQGGGGQRAMWRRVLRDVHTELGIEPPKGARAVRPAPAQTEAPAQQPDAKVEQTSSEPSEAAEAG